MPTLIDGVVLHARYPLAATARAIVLHARHHRLATASATRSPRYEGGRARATADSLANAGAGALWVGLVAWSLTAAPGPLPDPIGPELVAKLAAQPVPRPADINEYATQGSNPR